ncbi:MAG: redox-regulated ATPase YchF, partial [Deltaproteobacteria bacterium]|nr:redox-regulated ATPase YchF [Deltaproteobacteria bacterium]
EHRTAEFELLSRLKNALDEEKPLRELELTLQEEKLLRVYSFLSMKPCLVVVNVGEDQITQASPLESLSSSKRRVVPLSAKIEAEMAQLEEGDAKEFMESLGIDKPARDRVIASSYALLGLISFLTVGEDEVRAWTIREGTVAVEAGGVIHSDIQRGFIRAEVVAFEDLIQAGSMAAAKKLGKVRLEGKEYVLHDGDVSHFLFNV